MNSETQSKNAESNKLTLPPGGGIGIGIAIGAGLGILIGVAIDNIVLGIPIGVGAGIAIGVGIERRARTERQPLTARNKKIIASLAIVIAISIGFLLLRSEYYYLVIIVYIILYLLSPLIIWLLSKWE